MEITVGTQMMKVYDPENGNAYELRYCVGDEGDVRYTVGVQAYFDCPKKRVFLCKKYQRGLCGRNADCFSIHADTRLVAELRARSPNKWAQVVLNVASGTKEFSVPFEQTVQTTGRDRLMANRECIGKLCDNFNSPSASCPHDTQCPNIHVVRTYMRHIRNMWRLPCCNGCAAAKGPKALGPVPSMGVSVGGVHYPADTLASTKGLREMAGDDSYVVMLPVTRVCRPHLRQQCKWGDHCNNVHICRKRYQQPAVSVSHGGSASSQSLSDRDEEREEHEATDDDMPPALLEAEDSFNSSLLRPPTIVWDTL